MFVHAFVVLKVCAKFLSVHVVCHPHLWKTSYRFVNEENAITLIFHGVDYTFYSPLSSNWTADNRIYNKLILCSH